MEQCKVESLHVGFRSVLKGVVLGNIESTDQNKYSLGTHV